MLHEIEGKPLYRHSLDMLLNLIQQAAPASACYGATLTLVTQYQQIIEAVKPELDRYPFLRVVFSENSIKGVSYTIKAGISAIRQEISSDGDYFMFVVADQPYLRSETIEALCRAAEGRLAETISLRCGDRPGNPCLFHASLADELMALEGDRGGRCVIKKHSCYYVSTEDERELFDIDTKEQEKKLEAD